MVGPFDSAALIFPWKHEDPRVDALCRDNFRSCAARGYAQDSRARKFSRTSGAPRAPRPGILRAKLRAGRSAAQPTPVPFLDEPWYCCAEPMDNQFVSIGKAKEPVAKADQFVLGPGFSLSRFCECTQSFLAAVISKRQAEACPTDEPSSDSRQQAGLPDAQLCRSRARAGRRSRVRERPLPPTRRSVVGRRDRGAFRSAGGSRAAHRSAIAGASQWTG